MLFVVITRQNHNVQYADFKEKLLTYFLAHMSRRLE